ncbi:MAG: hypothetical protein K2X66_09040, partial [Cyanobacteria bacterium]|nr:hypothetical protein [Cyanobacteriota bacterium]
IEFKMTSISSLSIWDIESGPLGEFVKFILRLILKKSDSHRIHATFHLSLIYQAGDAWCHYCLKREGF